MATPLPSQGYLSMPTSWAWETAKITMKAGGYELSTTVGPNPIRETGSLNWVLPEADGKVLLNTLRAGMMNAHYTFEHNQFGTMVLRPNGGLSYSEIHTNKGRFMAVQCEFLRMK